MDLLSERLGKIFFHEGRVKVKTPQSDERNDLFDSHGGLMVGCWLGFLWRCGVDGNRMKKRKGLILQYKHVVPFFSLRKPIGTRRIELSRQ